METVSPSAIGDPRRLLVRGVNWLGDAVMTTPALLRLREKFAGARIALLTPEKLQELWIKHPAMDEIITFKAGETVFAVAKKLRAGRFDAALVLPNSPRSAIEVFLARIPRRIGHSRPWRNFFLTGAIAPRTDAVMMKKRSAAEIRQLISGSSNSSPRPPKTAHQMFEYLHLTTALGANPRPLPPQLFVAPEEIESARQKFGLENISGPIFGLNPGAEYGPAKRWPPERFIAAARQIQRETNCCWLIFGGSGDRDLAARIESEIQNTKLKVENLAGKTLLRELMALLKLCRVLLTNDTGPMHLAAALGVPLVAIFGSTSPELTGPILSNGSKILKSDVPCSPCFLRECPIDFRCMNGIGVAQAVEAVLEAVD